MYDTALSDVLLCPPDEHRVKIPRHLGTTVIHRRLTHVYADGSLLPVIAGGSVNAVEVAKPTLLTVPEFAAEIRVAPSTAWSMVKSGEIESIVIGRKLRRITRTALDEYIERRRVATPAS